ncbi:MAG: hypothetical protein JF567_10365 [Xanthomonadales bacterium]|nr:hypothetical protein [Xanthomonadales bacterium]
MKKTTFQLTLLATAIAIAPCAAFAQTTGTTTSTTSTTTTKAETDLITRYTTLAGSATAAQSLIEALHNGTSFTFPTSTTTTTGTTRRPPSP